MRKRLLNNWSLKLISLVIAFLLWVLVVQIGDPKDTREIGSVQVKLTNTELLERENKVFEILDNTDTVRVTVYAPISVFTQLRAADITAEADVSKLTDINTVPIKLSSTNVNVVDIRGSHDVVKLNVEDKASKYVNLLSDTVGTVTEGYAVTAVTPDQNRIEVSGPKPLVEQVRYAYAEIDVTDAMSSLYANVDIHLYDADGNLLESNNLKTNVDFVRMSVEILAIKTVPIEFNVSGTPAEGYLATGVVERDYDEVCIAGSTYALSRISKISIPEERLDITNRNTSLETTVDLREYLPDNVKLADTADFNGRVSVTVPIEPIEEKILQISTDNIRIENLPEGLEAKALEPDEESYEIRISGLAMDLESLQSNNVTGRVDIAEWMEKEKIQTLKLGSYIVPVKFMLPEEVSMEETLQIRIAVTEEEE